MAETASGRVLIVENQLLPATAVAMALRARGLVVEVVTGPSIDSVIERARALAPVLVLLDLDMGPPLGSGVDLIAPLLGAGGRIVMLTGVVDRVQLAACVEAGAVGIVSKTASFGQLVDAVDRAAAGEELLTGRARQDLLAELRARRRADSARLAAFSFLSPREQVVLAALVAGESADAIASSSYLSLSTIRSQIRSILLKLGVKSQLAAVALAQRAEWTLPADCGRRS
jgi:DNA-binding NarL/FixJ family response regulator